MATTHDPDGQDTSPYLRVPWPLAALGILVVLGSFLALGLFANANLHRTVGPLATQTPQAITAPTSASTSTPSLPAPTPTPAAQALGTAVGLTTRAVTATPLPALRSETATPTGTISPDLTDQIGVAYRRYWDIRAQAFYTLDPSRLDEVMTGEHLAAVEERLQELKTSGQAIETDIDHHYNVIFATSTDAQVADNYVDKSYYVDENSHTKLVAPTFQQLKEIYKFVRENGSWRVTELVRYDV